MKNGNLQKTIFLLFLLSLLLWGCGTSSDAKNPQPYGVFIGLDKATDLEKIHNYDTVVIDAAFFTKEDIQALRNRGNTNIYSYLNIGSVENFRPYYGDFLSITLGPYESWPEERWVDVSRKTWQDHVAQEAEALSAKGIDGFFLDNASIYYYYNNPEIYQGLLDIILRLKETEKPLIINGGDVFVTQGMKTGDLVGKIAGVNQETVFTAINFEEETFHAQSEEEQEYFMDYLSLCKEYHLQVYLLEYGEDKNLEKQIQEYCKENGFTYYLSPSLQLDKSPPQ